MTIGSHLDDFGGFKVEDWKPGQTLADLATTAYRITKDYDDEQSWLDQFKAYLETEGSGETRGLVVGQWADEFDDSSAEAIRALIEAKDRLPRLETLFIGDITYEENEISWIVNSDHGPLLQAYPNLRHYGARGGQELRFSWLNLPKLECLHVESGGLNQETVRDIARAELPELKHLELYLGTSDYGATYEVADLAPILAGRFPKLTGLGLMNAELQDEIAQVVVNAPVMKQLETLDLSLGTLTDEGGKALLESDAVRGLKRLDLSHHFMSEEMMAKLQALPLEVDVSDQQEDEDDWRFVSIGE